MLPLYKAISLVGTVANATLYKAISVVGTVTVTTLYKSISVVGTVTVTTCINIPLCWEQWQLLLCIKLSPW